LTIGAIIFIKYISVLVKNKKPLRKAAVSMLTGIAALTAASFAAGFFGFKIAVNIYTVFVALTLGAPGVVLIILALFVL